MLSLAWIRGGGDVVVASCFFFVLIYENALVVADLIHLVVLCHHWDALLCILNFLTV